MQHRNGFTLMTLAEFDQWLQSQRVGRTILRIQQHHTYNPSYSGFSGSNHFALQVGMRNYHVHHNGWADIGQHFTSFPDGTIMTGRSLERSPACIVGANANAICIEHLGNFDTGGDAMTNAHRTTIVEMTALLCKRFGVPAHTDRVIYHHWYNLSTGARNNGTGNNKSCPGTNFFGGNKVADCNAHFMPLVQQAISGVIPPDVQTPTLLRYAMVNTPSLIVRQSPGGARATDRASVLLGSVLRVFEDKDGWLRISDSRQHWVAGRLTLPVQRATVTANSLRVRSSPEVKPSNIVGSVAKGEEVFVEAEQNGWCKLAMENQWVSKQHLQFA